MRGWETASTFQVMTAEQRGKGAVAHGVTL